MRIFSTRSRSFLIISFKASLCLASRVSLAHCSSTTLSFGLIFMAGLDEQIEELDFVGVSKVTPERDRLLRRSMCKSRALHHHSHFPATFITTRLVCLSQHTVRKKKIANSLIPMMFRTKGREVRGTHSDGAPQTTSVPSLANGSLIFCPATSRLTGMSSPHQLEQKCCPKLKKRSDTKLTTSLILST